MHAWARATPLGSLRVVHGPANDGDANAMYTACGADVNARDKIRNTPSHYASKGGYSEVARLLVEHGANIDVEDDEGRTAYQVASEKGHHDFARFLSDRGSKFKRNLLL